MSLVFIYLIEYKNTIILNIKNQKETMGIIAPTQLKPAQSIHQIRNTNFSKNQYCQLAISAKT